MDPANGKILRKRQGDRDDVPPQGAKPIAEIVAAIEARGTGQVTSIEYEHGRWSIGLSVDPTAAH